MNLKKYSWLAVLIMLFAACQEDMLVENAKDQGITSLKVSMDDDHSDSRAQIVLNGSNTTKEIFHWNSDDSFTLFQKEKEEGSEWSEHVFRISKNYSDDKPAATADFSTTSALTPGCEFLAFYPTCTPDAKGGIQLSIDNVLPTNNAASWKSYFMNNMFMKTSVGTIGQTSADTQVDFEQLCGIIRIKYTNASKTDRTFDGIGVDGRWITGRYYMVSDSETFTENVKRTGLLGLTFTNKATVKAGDTQNFYILYFSNGVDGEVVPMSRVIVDLDVANKTTLVTPTKELPQFKAGQCYWLNITDNGNELLWTNDQQGGGNQPSEQGHNPEPYFSETVELMGLVWRLAGSYEYNQCQISTVANSADKHFASMKNHQAVTLAKQYYQQGVSYDAVTGYANQLVFDEDGEIIFDSDYLPGSNSSFDDRWSSQQKNNMLQAINDFYKESHFHDWFVSTEVEQQQAIASFKNVCNLDYTWFDSYYGKNDKVSSRIILSFMIGNSNNGISLKRKDGTLLLTPVLGSLSQNNGSVRFNGDMNLIVHEFSHPYCNPLIEANWSAISQKAEQVYSRVSSIMQNQAYSNAMTMMCETLVRSSAIRYMISHNQKNMVNMTLSYEESNGFMMVRTLVNTLEKREQEAAKYPTLADFMPELIDAINNFDPDDSSNQGGTAEPDTLPHDYVDLGLVMKDGKKLYFATRNVGETSPGGIGSYIYKWGATVEGGPAWAPETTYEGWPVGHKMDAEHDIATIKWGGDWHTPSQEEWNLLADMCDYEKKEADESGYGVAGYFFYNKTDRSKFIFLPCESWDGFWYWSSQISEPFNGYMSARCFNYYNDEVYTFGTMSIEHGLLPIRPVIASAGTFDANDHDYVDLGIQTSDGKKLYFATMNVGETSPAGISTLYRWGATKEGGEAWIPESYSGNNSGGFAGMKLDAAHDIATITWGEKWHIPSQKEWNLLVEKCDYERKEANESGYGVAGYFFYNKSDRSKFIFLPVSTWNSELEYWSSEAYDSTCAYTFSSVDGAVGCLGWIAGFDSSGFAIRPVFVE